MNQSELMKKMAELSALAAENGNSLTTEQIRDFLKNTDLTDEQFTAVYEYMSAMHISIKGFTAAIPVEEEAPEIPLSEEEQNFLDIYEEELSEIEKLSEAQMNVLYEAVEAGDAAAKAQVINQMLSVVVEEAKKLHGKGVMLQDLIQEGNIGLMLSMETLGLREPNETPRAYILEEIRRPMMDVLDEQITDKNSGSEIAEKLNRLSDSITELNDELNRQVSIEELSAFLDMPMEEIEDLIRLAGDTIDRSEDGEMGDLANAEEASGDGPDFASGDYRSIQITGIEKPADDDDSWL